MTKGMKNLMQMLEKKYDVYKKITKYPPGESGKTEYSIIRYLG